MIAVDPPVLNSDSYARHQQRGFDLPHTLQQADRALEELGTQSRQAKDAGAADVVELTSVRLTLGRSLEKEAASAIPRLEEAERMHGAAIARVYAADAAFRAGALDAKQAVKDWGELVASHAAERHLRAAMPALRSAVSGPLNKLARMTDDADARLWKDVFAETSGLLRTLVDAYGGPAAARDAARKYGEKSTAKRAQLWQVAEKVTSKDCPKGFLADLEAAFNARRVALEGARFAARQKMMSLES